MCQTSRTTTRSIPYIGKFEVDAPIDSSPPLVKIIVLTHYFDASLMHDVLYGKAVTTLPPGNCNNGVINTIYAHVFYD